MNIINSLIIREWFKSFFGALVVLFILITVGDIINGFLRNYETNRVLLEYALKLPELIGKCLPICCLLATLFSINNLKSNSELMAIMASGFSASSFYKSILACGVIVSFLQFYNLSTVAPGANKVKRSQSEKSRLNESKYIARSNLGDSVLMWYKNKNYFASFSAYVESTKQLKNLSLYFISPSVTLERVIIAKYAQYINDRWVVFNTVDINFLNDNLRFPQINIAESDTIELSQVPTDFEQFKSDLTTLNFFDLVKFVYSLMKLGINTSEYEIMVYDTVSMSIICFIFALLPVSGIYSPGRRQGSFGKNIIIVLIFSIFYWFFYSSLLSLAKNGKIHVLIATFTIPVLFSAYIYIIYKKNRLHIN